MNTTATDQDPSLCPHVVETKILCDRIKQVKPQDTQALFGDLHEMATLYYNRALEQATQSFKAAQVAAAVGTCFFLIGIAAVVIMLMRGVGTAAWISLIPGATIQGISGLNFYMYRKATRQFEMFHVCLERMGRFLMANSVCENIDGTERRDQARLELVRTMAGAPMLPIEGVRDERTNKPEVQNIPDKGTATKAATA